MSDTEPTTREGVKTRPRTVTQRPPLFKVLLHNDHYTTMEFVVQRPPLFKVLLHNDHYTTMEFVVDVLENVFSKSTPEAMQIMLNVHHNGVGLAGVYAHEVAETKVDRVHKQARKAGFPLRCSMEPE